MTEILCPPAASKSQALAWALDGAHRHEAAWPDDTIREMVDWYWRIGFEEGVRPDVALAQSAKETGYWSFRRDVKSDQWNLAGIGATGGVAGMRWPTLQAGVLGHVRRLRIYAQRAGLTRDLGLHDVEVLLRPLPGSVWGSASEVEDLGGETPPDGVPDWAPSPDYGVSIVRDYLDPMLRFRGYPDVTGHPAEKAIRWVISQGLMVGDGTSFRPDEPVTRAELATVIRRLGEVWVS